jgi:hypothetical protein
MVLSAGSAVANNAAANRQASAQAASMAAERARQRMLDDEARGVNEQARGRYEDIPAQQEAETSRLQEAFTGDANRGADVIAAALPRSNSNITVSDEAAKRADATGYANQQGEALARMRSFGDMFGGIGRGVAQDASQIGMIGGFKRGSQGVLPFELEAASMKGQGLRTVADLMNAAGGISLNAGLSGANLPGLGGGGSSLAPATSLRPMARPAGLSSLY